MKSLFMNEFSVDLLKQCDVDLNLENHVYVKYHVWILHFFLLQAEFSFVNWPFSLKLLWAPLVDSVYLSKFGRRKTWLVPVQYLISLFMILLSYKVNVSINYYFFIFSHQTFLGLLHWTLELYKIFLLPPAAQKILKTVLLNKMIHQDLNHLFHSILTDLLKSQNLSTFLNMWKFGKRRSRLMISIWSK